MRQSGFMDCAMLAKHAVVGEGHRHLYGMRLSIEHDHDRLPIGLDGGAIDGKRYST
jgi:hypothetical protein